MSEEPRYPNTEGRDLKTQVKELKDYIVNLQRYVRYALNNIDSRNMTKGARTSLEKIGSIEVSVKNTEEGLSTVVSKINDVETNVNNIKLYHTFIRYSANSDGSNMTEQPQSDTAYIGICTIKADTAPQEPSAYDWVMSKGNDGESGSGVLEIKVEYYLSTNKNQQVGGSWIDTMPEWSSDKYLWVRHKITYTNPYRVEYTEPQCDSSWEAVYEAKTEIDQKIDSVSIKYYDSEGNETTFKLSNGALDLSFLKGQIDDAEKTATNFISLRSDGGIEVGNKSGGSWTGYRSQMLADRFCIVDDSDNELASYEANAIYLGKSENNDTIIDFNNGMVTLSYDADNNRAKMRTNRMFIYSDTGYEISIGSSERDADSNEVGGQVFCNSNGSYVRGYSGDTYGVDLYSEIYLRNDGRGLWESVGADSEGYIQRSYIEMWPHKLLIRGQVLGTMWYMGRDDALIASTKYGSSESYFPLMDAKSQKGDWSAGVLGDNFYFIYTKDSDYESGNNVTEKFWFEPRIGVRMATSEAIDRYYVAYSSASGELYGCGFGIGSGGVNRGFYDYKRNQWTLHNDATDTILRTTGAFYFYADTDADTTPYGIVAGNAGNKHPLLRPVAGAYGYLGGVDYRWHTLYTYNVNTTYAVNVSSDRRLKKDISYDLSCVDGLFDLLHPAVYRMQGDEDGLLRFGFIAQDMAETLEHLGLNPDNYALLRKGEDGFYSIGYTETNALLWNEVQKLKARIAELEKGVA